MTLDEIYEDLRPRFDTVVIEEGILYIDEYYENDGSCKNDDDCSDYASDLGRIIVRDYPMLEVLEYGCHRHKYSWVQLKLKQ